MKGPYRDTEHSDAAPPSGVDRRAVLRAGAAGSLMLVTLPVACGGGGGGSISSGPIVFGNVSMVPLGKLLLIPNEPGFIGHDAGGLYAMSSTCTHQGCPLDVPISDVAQGMTCGCHGSRFDRNGAVVNGPAQAPLQHYQVDLAADGTVTIQGNKPVASSVRTMVV
jgi:nitrite reductase/ring-hydroxylating ferredoxin subunit